MISLCSMYDKSVDHNKRRQETSKWESISSGHASSMISSQRGKTKARKQERQMSRFFLFGGNVNIGSRPKLKSIQQTKGKQTQTLTI